jgi:hypothetical protein
MLVDSNQRDVCALFWKPDGYGYTTDLLQAGFFTAEQALLKQKARPTDLGVMAIDALANMTVHVDRGVFNTTVKDVARDADVIEEAWLRVGKLIYVLMEQTRHMGDKTIDRILMRLHRQLTLGPDATSMEEQAARTYAFSLLSSMSQHR